MAKAISGKMAGPRILEALGLMDRLIVELTLTVRMDAAVMARFKELVRSDVVVNGTHLVSKEQLDAVANEITSLRQADQGFRVWEYEKHTEEIGLLVLDGPAEQLARAVLAGDAMAALALADHIQEIWFEKQRERMVVEEVMRGGKTDSGADPDHPGASAG